MKYVLKDLAPRPEKDLFITQYWSDKQSDPPLHFHEDYMLSLTLNVRGTRITGRTADDFTEKDLIIIFPGVPHCYTRDEAYADIDCEAVAVQFSRDMPNWQLFETEYLQPIQKMLSLPVAGLHFSEMVVDRVRERLLQLPGLRGFESVALFLDILNDLATAGPDEMHIIGTTDYKTQADGNERIKKILQFVENNYHNKITLEDIGAEVGMSPSSVCRYFKKNTCQNLWTYINGFRIVRAAQMIVETDAPISEISTRCGFHNISNFNHAFRERIGSAPGEYRRKFGSTVISPDRKQVEEIGRKLDDLRNGGSLSEGGVGGEALLEVVGHLLGVGKLDRLDLLLGVRVDGLGLALDGRDDQRVGGLVALAVFQQRLLQLLRRLIPVLGLEGAGLQHNVRHLIIGVHRGRQLLAGDAQLVRRAGGGLFILKRAVVAVVDAVEDHADGIDVGRRLDRPEQAEQLRRGERAEHGFRHGAVFELVDLRDAQIAQQIVARAA